MEFSIIYGVWHHLYMYAKNLYNDAKIPLAAVVARGMGLSDVLTNQSEVGVSVDYSAGVAGSSGVGTGAPAG